MIPAWCLLIIGIKVKFYINLQLHCDFQKNFRKAQKSSESINNLLNLLNLMFFQKHFCNIISFDWDNVRNQRWKIWKNNFQFSKIPKRIEENFNFLWFWNEIMTEKETHSWEKFLWIVMKKFFLFILSMIFDYVLCFFLFICFFFWGLCSFQDE